MVGTGIQLIGMAGITIGEFKMKEKKGKKR